MLKILIMQDYNPSDTPPTIDFQNKLKIIQEEYKEAYKSRVHKDVGLFNHFELYGCDFNRKCELIYNHKVLTLVVDIINDEKHKDWIIKPFVKIRLNEIASEAIIHTHRFLEY